MRSRSAVVIPGRTAARHASSIAATIRPASRIFAVCACVLSVIIGAEPAVERRGLCDRAGEAVEKDSCGPRDLAETLADHANGQLVGYVRALVEEGLHPAPELGLPPDVLSEELARREVGPAILLGERLGLGPLSHSGRTDEHEVALPRAHRPAQLSG